MHTLFASLLCVVFFTIPAFPAEKEDGEMPSEAAVETSETWAQESSTRAEHLYPSIWGQVGLFRVRSGYSLPEGAISFGIGGEFYSVRNAPEIPSVGTGLLAASTIAENLFIGYSPYRHLTLSITRRNSSTTFNAAAQAPQLISSLGDFTFGASYEIEITPGFSVQPLANFLVASNFNSLAPSGSTLSAGLGAAATLMLANWVGLPLFLHGNLLYHSPQIGAAAAAGLQPEMFFQFSRFHTATFGLGAELHLGSWVPFVEYTNTGELGSALNWFQSPSKITVGTRLLPLENKSLSILAGVDVGTGRAVAAGVPYTAPVQVVAQLSYTTGLQSSERKHYATTRDVKVVNRKFIVGKNINFKVGSSVLEPSSAEVLDQIAEVILKNRVNKLLIVGHTDSSHTDEFNIKLSLDRAGTVKKYLVSREVPEETLLTQGYGKRRPRASNTTEKGRSQNRRVEFLIVE